MGRGYIMGQYLILKNLKIQNANALSSPFTIGFPSMTAWMGASHFIERKLRGSDYNNFKVKGIGIVSHEFDLQTYKDDGGYVESIVAMRHPVKSDGKTASFIEEARCHLTVSLVLEVEGVDEFKFDELENSVEKILPRMKFASGDLMKYRKPKVEIADGIESELGIMRKLMPGYVLIERRQYMLEAMQEGKDALEALLEGVEIENYCEFNEKKEVEWKKKRKYDGWVVPVSTGFHGVSKVAKAGTTKNQRDPSVPHRFVESVVTLGEFVMPYKLDKLEQLLWHYEYKENDKIYLCYQKNVLKQ